MTALILGSAELAALRELRERAAQHPVYVPALPELLQTATGQRQHSAQMEAQTVIVPLGFRVVFSFETGHPAGIVRHMSVSMVRPDRLPVPEAVWMLAEALGFAGGLEACKAWPERLSIGNTAINLAQPVSVTAADPAEAAAAPPINRHS